MWRFCCVGIPAGADKSGQCRPRWESSMATREGTADSTRMHFFSFSREDTLLLIQHIAPQPLSYGLPLPPFPVEP